MGDGWIRRILANPSGKQKKLWLGKNNFPFLVQKKKKNDSVILQNIVSVSLFLKKVRSLSFKVKVKNMEYCSCIYCYFIFLIGSETVDPFQQIQSNVVSNKDHTIKRLWFVYSYYKRMTSLSFEWGMMQYIPRGESGKCKVIEVLIPACNHCHK